MNSDDYILLQDMTDEQIADLGKQQLKDRPLAEFLSVNKSRLKEETRRLLLSSRRLPEQLQIQMAWNNQTITREALGGVIIRKNGNLRSIDVNGRPLDDFKSLTTTQARLLKLSLHLLTKEQEDTVLDHLLDASSRQAVEDEYTLHKFQNLNRNDLENWPLDKLKNLTLEQALAFRVDLLTEEKESTILDNLRDAGNRQTVEDEYTLQKIRQLRYLERSFENWPDDKFKGLTLEQALEFPVNLLTEEKENTILDNLRDASNRQTVEDKYTLQKIRSLNQDGLENWPLDKFKGLTLEQALAFPLDLLTEQQANTLLDNLRDGSHRQTVEDKYKHEKELRRTRGSNKHHLKEMDESEIAALTRGDLENRPLDEFEGLPYHHAIRLDSTLLTAEQEETVLRHMVNDGQMGIEILLHGDSRQIVKDEYKRQKLQKLSRRDLENLPLDAFYDLTKKQAIALDSYSLTEEQERTVLDNLRNPRDRAEVEGEYTLQKPFQMRWNADNKRIECYVWSRQSNSTGWVAKNTIAYIGALRENEEFHIRRERLNASSMSINPPAETNILATPCPQTANEIALSENLIKILGRQPTAIGQQIESAIENFRKTAAGEEYKLDQNQIETLLENNSTVDFDIARTPLELGIPVEYLMRMAQLNEEQRLIRNMLEATKKVIDANQPFFRSHKFLTDFEIPFERRAPLLEQLHQIRELRELQKLSDELVQFDELVKQSQLLEKHIGYLQKRKVSGFSNRNTDLSLEDSDAGTLKLLIESSSVIAAHIQSDAPLLSTIESFATQQLGDEETRTMIRKFIDSENLPELTVPNQMLWLEDNPPEEDLNLNNEIRASPRFIDSVARLVPGTVNRKIFDDLLEVAPEDFKGYFSADEKNAVFTISPEIFSRAENSLRAQSKQYVLKLIKSQMDGSKLTPAEQEALADARVKVKGLKALARICHRWPRSKDYQETSESAKKEFGEFLLAVAVDVRFRESNNTQFITALGACGDQVSDAIKALKTGYTKYQEEKGNISTQRSIEFRVEQARLETLGKVANLEIYAKLKKYAYSDIHFQEIHVKQTLEVKVGEKLHMTTTPRDAQYHDPDINDERVNRALKIIDAMERGDKAAAAKYLKPLIQDAEEGIEIGNKRIEEKNVELASRGEPLLPLRKPLSDNFKDVNNWLSERELLLADDSLKFSLRKEIAFGDAFSTRKAAVDKDTRGFEDMPNEDDDNFAAWEKNANQHREVVENWDGDLTMSLVQVSKMARQRVHDQLSAKSQKEIYTVQPLNGLIAASKEHPTAIEDFYQAELEIAKETHPSLKTVTIHPACEPADKQRIWFAARLQGFSVEGYLPQSKDHEKLMATRLIRQLQDVPLEKISEYITTTTAKQGEQLGNLFVVKTNNAGDAWIKPKGESSSLVRVDAAHIKGLPLKTGQKTPVDFVVGELKWSNTNREDNLNEVKDLNQKIKTHERERHRLEKLASDKTASSAVSNSNPQPFEANALIMRIDPEKRYNQLLFLQESANNNPLFAATNEAGKEEFLFGNPPSAEHLNPGDVFSFDKGTWERKTPAPIQSPAPESIIKPSSPTAPALGSDNPLARDREQLERDAGLPKGTPIDFYPWNGKFRLTDPFYSITSNGAWMRMQASQSSTPKAAFRFISNEQLQQLGLLDQNNQRTDKGETFLQKNAYLPKDSQQLPKEGRKGGRGKR